VVSAGKKYILHTTSGREELYDLAADPGEQENLAAVAPADTLLAMRAQLEKASGWAVRKGLRLRIPSNVEVTTITFDAPVFAAGVMDPEFNEKTRANLEWGEHPRVTPEEVGAAGLSADGRVATFTPGTDAPGHTWWVQCIEVTCPDATLAMGDKSVRLSTADRLAGGTRYAVEDGWVHIPLDSGDRPEAETEVGSQMEQLEELGYVAPADGDEGRD
jgi:hypothetical protein